MPTARDVFNELRGFVAESLWTRMIRYNGRLRSTRLLPSRLKQSFANRVNYQERTEIALTVAGHYVAGDYFEFGSAGFNTFRSFLSAFDLNGLTDSLPNTRFFAFDVFGDVDSGSGVPAEAAWYFEGYRDDAEYRNAERQLKQHGLLHNRVELVKGYFEKTLADGFKERLREEGRRIGFAFIDVNIAPSYRTVLEFLPEFMLESRCFVYMDEYFLVPEVPALFEQFCDRMAELKAMRPYYIRNAGSFGALFCFMIDTRTANGNGRRGANAIRVGVL